MDKLWKTSAKEGASMNPSLQDVTNWFNGKSNHTLMIEKEEERDRDRVQLRLERFDVSEHHNQSIDGYGDSLCLLLHGPGVVITAGHEAPLPGDSFVIGLDDLTGTEVREDQVVLLTERGKYSITTGASPDVPGTPQ